MFKKWREKRQVERFVRQFHENARAKADAMSEEEKRNIVRKSNPELAKALERMEARENEKEE